MHAMRDASANNPSESIAPAPTGSASVSTSSCFEDDELLTKPCHPEIAPQAIATKRIGQIGPSNPCASVKNGTAPSLMAKSANGVANATTIIKMTAATAGQNARRYACW